MTTPSQVPVPSEKPQDLLFNAGKIDEYVTSQGWTYTDRFSVKHYTIEGINHLAQEVMSAFGYVPLPGVTFTTGATVSQPNEVLFNTVDNSYYKWTGSFANEPKIVPANSTPESAGGVGPGKWLNVGDTVLRTDLSKPTGSQLVGYRYSNVYDVLSRIKTLSDYNAVINPFGYNPAVDPQIINSAAADNFLLVPGGIAAAVDGSGFRRSNLVASFRHGARGNGFNAQVTGVDSGQAFAQYSSCDSVCLFGDITSWAYDAWEVVSDPVYVANGVSTLNDLTKLKKGMAIQTDHATPWFGVVASVSGNMITLVDGWWKRGDSVASIPTAGSGLHLNIQSKVWAQNFNMRLNAASRAAYGVVAEWGIINQRSYSANTGGLDLVLLAQSTFDAGFGVWVRPGNGATVRYQYGYISSGSDTSYLSQSGVGFNPTYGFMVSGPHEAGFLATGVGTGKRAIQVQNAAGQIRLAIDGNGTTQRQYRSTLILSGTDHVLDGDTMRAISIVGLDQVVTLANTGLTQREVVITKYSSAGKVTVKPATGNIFFKTGFVASVELAGAGSLSLELINIDSGGNYQWACSKKSDSA